MRRTVLCKRGFAGFTWPLLALLVALLSAATLMAAVPEFEEDDPLDGGVLMLRGKGVAEGMPAIRLGTEHQAGRHRPASHGARRRRALRLPPVVSAFSRQAPADTTAAQASLCRGDATNAVPQ